MRLIKIGAVLVLLAGVVYLFPPLRMAALVVAGKNQGCTISRAMQIEQHKKDLTAAKDRILAASKKIETDPAGYSLWDTPDGKFWIPTGSEKDYVLPFNLAEENMKIYGTGQWDVQKGDVVLDCGANIGVFTKMALNNGADKVVAIEPAPENIECLRRNFKDEIAAGRVIVYGKGVWDKEDFLTLHRDPRNSAADSFLIVRPGSEEVLKLPLTTIDKLVEELKLEKVSYIKMDIEGAEPNALEGGKQTIAKYHPHMGLSVYHAPDHPEKVPAQVKAAWSGYRTECGPCAYANGAIRPDILWFY